MTQRTRLTDAGSLRLKPGRTDYTVWDTVTPGLGVRIRTSGFRGYVFHQRGSGKARRVSLGPGMLKGVRDAHRECLSIQLDEHAVGSGPGTASGFGIPMFRDYVADPWMAGHCHRWKPPTRKGVVSLLRNRLLPVFGHLPPDRITPAGVGTWFECYSATSPCGTNKALTLLRQIMTHAVSNSLIPANPARRTQMNPRPRLTRFLSAAEIVRLHETIDLCVAECPACEGQADIIRLLLYTGCRKREARSTRSP